MTNNLLQIYSDPNNKNLISVENGIEEQGIYYEVLPLKLFDEINLKDKPFNMVVIIHGNEAWLNSNDFKFGVNTISKNIFKEFGLDVGRYIKGIPLKGEWSE
ncbi:hypothetical protein [Clostridium carnis]